MSLKNGNENTGVAPGPGRGGAALDIAIYLAAGIGFYLIEMGLRASERFPLPAIYEGAFALVMGFVACWVITRRRGQSLRELGLRRPPNWWTVPVWGFVVLVVNGVAQITVVPVLSQLLGLEPPDMSKYEALVGNLPMLMILIPGTMITGGFMEEVIYRGFMVDRLVRILGPGRRSPLWAALLCGVPFGLIHFQWGVGGILLTTVMGSVLGLMFLLTKRNLWPLIAAHATMDAFLMSLIYTGATI